MDDSNRAPQTEPQQKKSVKSTIIYWLLLNLGTLLVAVGVYFFKVPNNFATGGVSGISIILSKICRTYAPEGWQKILTQSNFTMTINVILLIIGFIFLGRDCSLKTVYCSLVYSGENMLFEWLLPFKKDSAGEPIPLTGEPVLELVYAMLLTGIGAAILFYCRASSGGTDIIALIFKKRYNMDTGKALLVADFLIAFSNFFIAGIEPGLFSMLGLFAKAFIIDGVIDGVGKSKYMTIITEHPKDIERFIIETMNRDYTAYTATGGYTGDKKTVLITVCKRSEAIRLKIYVKRVDRAAFTIITDANEILGKGFRDDSM